MNIQQFKQTLQKYSFLPYEKENTQKPATLLNMGLVLLFCICLILPTYPVFIDAKDMVIKMMIGYLCTISYGMGAYIIVQAFKDKLTQQKINKLTTIFYDKEKIISFFTYIQNIPAISSQYNYKKDFKLCLEAYSRNDFNSFKEPFLKAVEALSQLETYQKSLILKEQEEVLARQYLDKIYNKDKIMIKNLTDFPTPEAILNLKALQQSK